MRADRASGEGALATSGRGAAMVLIPVADDGLDGTPAEGGGEDADARGDEADTVGDEGVSTRSNEESQCESWP